MTENFNRQFLMLDFALLDDPDFQEFLRRPEFAVYLALRRFVWRGGPHRLQLQDFYHQERKLVAAVGRQRLAATLGIKTVNRVTDYLKALEELRVIKRLRTGRETIFVLGEWVDISEQQDGSRRKEWFYLESRFSAPATDAQQGVRDQTTPEKGDQTTPPSGRQTTPEKGSSNREVNRETNTVSYQPNGKSKNPLKALPDLDEEEAATKLMTDDILAEFGDHKSNKFYYLVASKVPHNVIFQALSEIKADGAKHPARVFTYRMKQYATERLAKAA